MKPERNYYFIHSDKGSHRKGCYMARRAIVTRTVMGTQVTVLGLNTETSEPENRTYILSGTYRKETKDSDGKVINSVVDEKKLLKDVKKAYDTDIFQNVKIVDIQSVNKLYGMWEEDFITNAMELDPETRKPLKAVEQ